MSYVDEMVSKDLIKEIRELRKAYEKTAEKDDQGVVATVNMPLKNYNIMRDEIEDLRREIESLKAARDTIGLLLSKIDIPFEELKIDPRSIEYFEDNGFEPPWNKKYVIRFITEENSRRA